MAHCHAPTPQRQRAISGVAPALALLACGLLVACKPQPSATQPSATKEFASGDSYFAIDLGEAALRLQLALTPTEWQKGLMFRDAMAADHGMLFLFERPEQRGFWMRNTHIPLDLGYFDASGRLLEIHKLFPFDETLVLSRSDRVLIAVETNAGWFAKNGVRPGDRLDLAALKAAVVARGISIKTFALED